MISSSKILVVGAIGLRILLLWTLVAQCQDILIAHLLVIIIIAHFFGIFDVILFPDSFLLTAYALCMPRFVAIHILQIELNFLGCNFVFQGLHCKFGTHTI